ncbi:MAG: AAA domain-containing protein [Planctomycetota bacterium]
MAPKPTKNRSDSSGFGNGLFGNDSTIDRPNSKQTRAERSADHWRRGVPYPSGLPVDSELDREGYFSQLGIWLDLEAAAERERLAERRQVRARADVEKTGETILNLDLTDSHSGLAGRYLLDFSKPNARELPMSRLKVGSPVIITFDDDPSDGGLAGVVSRRHNHSIQVATDRLPERDPATQPTTGRRGSGRRGVGQHGKASGDRAGSDRSGRARFRLDLSPDETTRQRQLSAMATAQLARGRSGRLRDVMLGNRNPRFDGQPLSESELVDKAVAETRDEIEFQLELNPPQRDAVAFALLADDVAILHGPPGTGKTTTLAEVIVQAVRRGDRVLACAASNTAVDNLLERLTRLIPNVVRVGHPARVMEWLRDHTLDSLVEHDPSAAVVKDLRRELDRVVRDATRLSGDRHARRTRRELFAEAGRLRGQIRSIERTIVRGVLDRSDVICTTTTIDEELLGDDMFDLVVVDEACQCTEPGMWQAILRAHRVVLAGDHCQLPPTVLSDRATSIGMRDSLMQRLVHRFGESVFRRLTVQYRMNESIMRFSSDWFYDGSLIADVSVRHHRLCDLDNVDENETTTDVLHFVDTAGAGYDEQIEPDGLSKLNPGEATIVSDLVAGLIESGIPAKSIAIIAPYAAQVRALRSRIASSDIEIDTVDGFQGREKDVVLLSMVRSNATGEIGFLSDRRRSNVAMTRARRKLVMVGDSATLGNHDFYTAVLDYFESNGRYQSVFERIALP